MNGFITNLIEPSYSLNDKITHREVRLSLSMQIILLILWIIHDFMKLGGILNNPLPIGMSVVLLISYVIGRKRSIQLSTFLMLSTMDALPFITLTMIDNPSSRLVFVSLAWLVCPIIMATYLLHMRDMLGIFFLNFTGLIITPLLIADITANMMMSSISFLIGVSMISIVASWLRKTHLELITHQSKSLFQQKSELELYSSILKHDIRNDLSLILGAVELCTMIKKKNIVRDSMDIICAAGARMIRVLDAFSQTPYEDHKDFITLLESVATEAEKAHPNMSISVEVDDSARKVSIIPGRLLPMVFENLFRNAAVYAGENPIITVEVIGNGDGLQIDVHDSGPGIAPTIRDRLFQRGASSSGEGKGLGLYLSKRVIEAQGGSVELLDEPMGCTFRIRLNTQIH